LNLLLKVIACAGALASAGLTAAPLSAQGVCGADAGPTQAGATVRDQDGVEIGWVSLMQCSAVGQARLLVRLNSGLGSAVKIVPLDAVAEKGGEVIIAKALEAILKLPQLGEAKDDVTIADTKSGAG